jgi:diacylglycerol kinase family enzyme
MKVAGDAAQRGCFDAVVAAGGDGTLHDAAEGLIGSSTPLGIIPMGTGNVFAQEMKLPRSPDELVNALQCGEAREVPVGQVNGRPFLFVVGVGFDAAAVRFFEQESTRSLGQAGFVWPVLRALVSYRDPILHVTSPRGDAEVPWVIVTRVKRYAGNLMLAPEADPQHAQFYVLRMSGSGPLNRIRQLSALAIGYLRYDPDVSVECVDWVKIDGDQSIPVQVDGEVLGNLPLEICIHPKRLRLIWPSGSST